MIGKITGRIDHRGPDHVLVEAGGLGYIVHCSDRTLAGLPGEGEVVALYTELLVREDLMQLFGFPTLLEREWHRLLMTVQGVGAKAALAVLGTLGPDGLMRALSTGDATAFRAAPGVGPKLAQRIVLELKSKSPAMVGTLPRPAPLPGRAAAPQAGDATADALSALTNLGYAPTEAAMAISTAAAEGAEGAAALIRAALRLLAPKG